MVWLDIVLALVRRELKARYSGFGGWQVSANGAFPIALLAAALFIVWR